jgi:ZIP family zinc transporter
MDYLILFLAGSATALATGIGAVPVFCLSDNLVLRFQAALWGLAAGTMAVASVLGLLLPALGEGSALAVVAGFGLGVAFMVAARVWLSGANPTIDGHSGTDVRTSLLVFGVLFVHSVPEGLAIGTAYASNTAGLGLFVVLAIALQNIPEGTSVAIPMNRAGFSGWRQFWAAVGTSVPQPVAAIAAFALVETVEQLLPASFGFAAGAMLALVALELVPNALKGGRNQALGGALIGAAVILALALLLGV